MHTNLTPQRPIQSLTVSTVAGNEVKLVVCEPQQSNLKLQLDSQSAQGGCLIHQDTPQVRKAPQNEQETERRSVGCAHRFARDLNRSNSRWMVLSEINAREEVNSYVMLHFTGTQVFVT